MTKLNESIKDIPIPDRMRRLPISAQGYPIPWFVPFTHDGEPVPQAADPVKRLRAARLGLCWCCGEPLGIWRSFVIGPMCVTNRITSEPPNHKPCAEYAVRVCPFLARPKMRRNPTTPADQKVSPGGIMIERNPGVAAIWTTRKFRAVRDHDGGLLFSLGDPTEVTFYCEGHLATQAEVLESMESGIPILREVAERDGSQAVAMLDKQYARALRLLPSA